MTMAFSSARMGNTKKKSLEQVNRGLQLMMATVNFYHKIAT